MNVKDSIRKRLNKSFAMISLVCSIGLVICGISLFVISSQYHNALTNYGFAQGDIGKAMTTFSEARSALRAVIGYTDMNVLQQIMELLVQLRRKRLKSFHLCTIMYMLH